MDSKTRTLALSVLVTIILWLLGGFVVNNALGIILIMLGFIILGWAGGNKMNTPNPTHNP